MKKCLILILLIAMIVILSPFAYLFFPSEWMWSMLQRPFDSATWKACSPKDAFFFRRKMMLSDLFLSHQIYIGMQRDALEEVLGTPESECDGTYFYTVGLPDGLMCNGEGITEYLEFEVDSERVTDINVNALYDNVPLQFFQKAVRDGAVWLTDSAR